MSGDIQGTPGGYVMGPKGMLEMKEGLIRAARHVHMSPADATFYGVKHLDRITLKVTSPACNTRFDDLISMKRGTSVFRRQNSIGCCGMPIRNTRRRFAARDA